MWTDKTIDLVSLTPDFFSEIYEYQQLFSILTDELNILQENLATYKNDLFLNTASDDVITRYQQLLKTSGTTTEQKRENIISKFSETVPFNLDTLKSVINSYLKNPCSAVLTDEGKILVYYTGENYITDDKDVYANAYNVIPANLQIEICYFYTTFETLLKVCYSSFSNVSWNDVKFGLYC